MHRQCSQSHRAWGNYKIDLRLMIENAGKSTMVSKGLLDEVKSEMMSGNGTDAKLVTYDTCIRAGGTPDIKVAAQTIKDIHATIKESKEVCRKIQPLLKH